MLAVYLALIDNKTEQLEFETIYHTYRGQMFAVAESVLHNYHDAEEAVGDAFVAAAKNMGLIRRIQEEQDLRSYMLKSAKRCAMNMLPGLAKREQLDDADGAAAESEISDDAFLDMICTRFAYREVVAAINLLGDRYREALYFHFVLEFTIPETAALLGRKVSVIKQRLVRGKRALIQILKEKGGADNAIKSGNV